MGSINFKGLQKTQLDQTDFTYVDIHLDIAENNVLNQFGTINPKGKDIKVDFDENAIKNSLKNILATIPGERFLIPEFGTNLKQYLFSPVTQSTAKSIGETILRSIETWEPRVTVEHVKVIGKPFGSITSKDSGRYGLKERGSMSTLKGDEYHVTIIISIPALKIKTEFTGILTEDGFATLDTKE